MTDKQNPKDIKAVDDIRKVGYGVSADDAKIDAQNKKDHVAYDAKGDTRNRQNTVQNR
jgi:hypothetical protein